MRARGISLALVSALVASLTTGCFVREDTHCSDVYPEYLRLVERDTAYEESAAVEGRGLGQSRLEEQEEAALVARAARLELVLARPECFSTWDVRGARESLPAVREKLADHAPS